MTTRMDHRFGISAMCGIALISLAAVVSLNTRRPSEAESADLLHVAVDQLADESSCIECHEQAAEFFQTGHANTLIPAGSEPSIELLKRISESTAASDEGTSVTVDDRRPFAVFDSSAGSGQLPLDWCFGSGRHARTWVSTLADSKGTTDLLEFRWTWYASLDGFDITPGQPKDHFSTYLGPCGVFYDHPKARRCFACHSTRLPIDDGRLRLEDFHPGVTCQRCHGPRAEHVATEGKVQDGFWQTTTAEDAVNRCAQCHRRADEVEAEEIHPDNSFLARFQPIGLVQSKCFTESGTLTCTTCHDPHRPMDAQDSLGIWQCVQCHDPQQDDHTLCGAGETDRCLKCHMPKVQGDDPLFFTDHWIRVR